MSLPTIKWPEVSEKFLDMLVEELDPRTHVSSKAFFEHLKPEVADELADFYNRYNRLLLETAFKFREVMEHFEQETDPEQGLNGDPMQYAWSFIGSLYPDRLAGYKAIEPTLGALRGFDDDGLAIQLGNNGLERAKEILDDEAFGEHLARLVTVIGPHHLQSN